MKVPKLIKLDVNKQIYDNIIAKQADSARYLLFRLLDNGVPFSLEAKTLKVYGVKPDGKLIFNNITIVDIKRGLVELQLTTQMLAVPGILKLELTIHENGDIFSTLPFEIEVVKSIRDDKAIESTNEFSALTRGLLKLDEWDKLFKETSGKIEEKYTERLNNVSSQLSENINKSFINSNKVLNFAHRGSGLAPENTLTAIELAGLQGFDGVELDLSRTSDDEIVLMHDETVDRMTDGTGRVDSFTLDQIRNLNIDSGTKVGYYPDLRVPTLDEALELLIKYELNGMLELKNLNEITIKKVVDKVIQYGLEFKVCFNGQKSSLDIVRNYNKNIMLAPFGAKLNSGLLDIARTYKPNVLLGLNEATLTKEDVDTCHREGIRVDAWTVSDSETLERMKVWGVDIIVGGIV